MQAVPPVGASTLDSLRRSVEQRSTRSVDTKAMDTRDAWQVWFLSFLAKHNINEAEFLDTEHKEDLMACYIVYLLDGNTIQGKMIKASTAKGYLQAVNVFCSANGKATAVNLKLQTSKAVRLLAEQAKFE